MRTLLVNIGASLIYLTILTPVVHASLKPAQPEVVHQKQEVTSPRETETNNNNNKRDHITKRSVRADEAEDSNNNLLYAYEYYDDPGAVNNDYFDQPTVQDDLAAQIQEISYRLDRLEDVVFKALSYQFNSRSYSKRITKHKRVPIEYRSPSKRAILSVDLPLHAVAHDPNQEHRDSLSAMLRTYTKLQDLGKK